MVSSSKSKAESAPNASAAYDLSAVATALQEVDKDLAPAAFDMSALSAALGETERRRRRIRLGMLIRRPCLEEPCFCKTKFLIPQLPTFKPHPRRFRLSRVTGEETKRWQMRRMESFGKAMEILKQIHNSVAEDCGSRGSMSET